MGKNTPLRRRRPIRRPKPRFLIVREGEVTEPRYFNDLRLSEKALIELVVVAAGVPKSIVERAVQLKKDAERDARRTKDQFLRYEEVWCVFDIDEHPQVREAKQQAKDHRLETAISNPCFELWALLHFQDQEAHIERHPVQHLCRKYMPDYQKELDYQRLEPKYKDALERAKHLEHIYSLNDCPGTNPSTGVHRLVSLIKTRGQGLPG